MAEEKDERKREKKDPIPKRPELPGRKPPGMWGSLIRTLLFFVAIFFLFRVLFSEEEKGVRVSYTAFRDQVSRGNVESVVVQEEEITGERIIEMMDGKR